VLEFLVDLGTPFQGSGSVPARASWVRALSSNEYDCGVEFLEGSTGLLELDQESLSWCESRPG